MPAATAATAIPEALEFKAGNRTAILLNTFTMLIYFLLLSYQAFNATTFVKKKSANAQTPPMNKKTFWMFNKRISCLYIIIILKLFPMSELTYSFFSTNLFLTGSFIIMWTVSFSCQVKMWLSAVCLFYQKQIREFENFPRFEVFAGFWPWIFNCDLNFLLLLLLLLLFCNKDW